MFHLRVTIPSRLTEQVLQEFSNDPAVTSLSVLRGASLQPLGDVVLADVAREATNEIVDALERLGVPECGTVHLDPVSTWISRSGYEAQRSTPGASADAVVWTEVTQRAYEETELNWTYLAFMTLATVLASIAIVVDSQVLVIGAMVLGPEFVAVAALGLALVRRRRHLFTSAVRTLVGGFAAAIVVATILTLVARLLGWVVLDDVTGPRPGTDFIYTPDKWSFIVAVIAAAAGVLSLTSARIGGLSGVFISVTTVPAAGNIAIGIAFTQWSEVVGSSAQLALNVSGMALAGWLTLLVQQRVWKRKTQKRRRRLDRSPEPK